ncbi:MAG: metallophosphoesterase family protein [Deltaproteobacteria bacterium]|nr:metallophosphoesterase family protein [Deltaproteobacteria bacterium]
MPYAIISDVHSNLEALEVVLQEIDSLGIKDIICLGDLVGYNANPNECIDLVRRSGIRCIMGNHDLRAIGLQEPIDFNPIASEAILWTRRRIAPENIEFLRGLPRRLFFDDGRAMAIHGSIHSTDTYIHSPWDAARNFAMMEENPGLPPVCFFGHTHVKICYQEVMRRVITLHDDEVDIVEGDRYLINPGGVGQPRDMNPRTAFLVYDADARKVRFFRKEYAVKRTYQKVVDAGLPRELADRLLVGW